MMNNTERYNRVKHTMILLKKVFVTFLLINALSVQATDYRLFIGQMKTLKIADIERVAVGNAGLVSTSILDNGSLLILGEKTGDTELQIWLKNGKIIAHNFYITDGNSARNIREIKRIIGDISSVKVEQIGQHIVIKGHINYQQGEAIKKIIRVYPKVIDLTQVAANNDLAAVLAGMPNIEVRHTSTNAFVTGNVSAANKTYITKLQSTYPQLVDLTVSDSIVPMVYMNVKITEFSNKASESLGIAWGQSFNGPQVQGNTFDKGGLFNKDSLSDYFFGIAYDISSLVNLAINSGDAILLASPTLSALSGEDAEFLAGGEFPIAIPDGQGGTSIEYKEYGVILKITPTVDANNRITATIEIEVSSLDSSVSVGGAPGLKKRKTSTVVSLNEGETFAISGLINRELSKGVQRVPFLSRIPVLGHLFRSDDFINNKSDMVIFITPKIVNAQSAENIRMLENAQQYKDKFYQNTNMSLEIIE